MTLSELEAFNRAIALAEVGNKTGAYEILTELYRNNPENSRILLCLAFTAGSLNEARKVLEKARLIDPTNPSIYSAKSWLARREELEKKPQYSAFSPGPVTTATQIIYRPVMDIATLQAEQASGLAVLLLDEPPRSEPVITLKSITAPNTPSYRPLSSTNVNLPALKPNVIPPALAEATTATGTWPVSGKKPRFQKIFFFWLGLLIVATILLIGVVLVQLNPFGELTPAEKSYWEAVRQINLQANSANMQLQDLEKQGLNQPELKPSVQAQLQVFIDANNRLRSIQSPSSRFEQVDGLLALAYSDYSEGARLIIEGLDKNDFSLISQGNQSLAIGNDYLRKAKDELKILGLV